MLYSGAGNKILSTLRRRSLPLDDMSSVCVCAHVCLGFLEGEDRVAKGKSQVQPDYAGSEMWCVCISMWASVTFNCERACIYLFLASTVAFDSWSLGTAKSLLGTMTEVKKANTNICT